MPGNEFLLGNVKDAFDDNGNLKDEGTRNFLGSTLQKFVQFIEVISKLDGAQPKDMPEDLHAKGKITTTIEDVDMAADDWVEQASAKVEAVKGDTYVELDRGVLTVDQIDAFLKSMPMELTYADSNNQFLYYNHNAEADEMFAKRQLGQVGNPLANCHPPQAYKNVEWVIQQLRSGKQDVVRVHVPTHGPDKFVVHNYQAIHDDDGNYMGINEYILDFKPIVDWYLKQTGQQLAGAPQADAVSGASEKATAPAAPAADAVSGASEKAAAPTTAPATPPVVAPTAVKPDAVSGASENGLS